MNKEPVLVIMAAGMGSRYGGLKQIDPIDEQGHIIIDFSIYDAIRAGFKKIIFIIKHEIEADFKEVIGDRISKFVEVNYVYQDLNNLPEGFTVPEGRVKPWGTSHAILSCLSKVDGPFAVINADDCYGADAYKVLYDYLIQDPKNEFDYAMVGYILENTLTDNGHVARGVCSTTDDGYLACIDERIRIEKKPDHTAYTEDEGATWVTIPKGSPVSMNMWGFQASILKVLNDRFAEFLENNLEKNPMKCEYLLPTVVGELLKEKKATVKVLHSADRWYGVTYKEDKETVMNAIKELKEKGVYPTNLWEEK
ncbi:MAG: sugar phosphate nucleotidyltransferase [Oscillospiraceae bacterium]